ncbi:hypothetical protein [Halocynthiibacter namhaensis]|uniref:hypothetical protein n=1 Tax=Halocynthiibacter namhaensis TaxID=1290553 RepID=UPI000692446D|nr:hypothetical protein [Halocynthiibacter namhaensis]
MKYLSALFLFCLLPVSGFAQDVGGEGAEKYTIVETVDAPTSETSREVTALTRNSRVTSDVTYVSQLDGQLASGRAQENPKQNTPLPGREFSVPSGGGMGVMVAFVIILGAIFLWLKFGGAGMLLSREPSEVNPKPSQAPDTWKIASADLQKGPQSILDKIAAMQDRSEALVLLLRYSLLSASESTSTRFARADTERGAFERLPTHWAHIHSVEAILRQAELAHYGGRPVSDSHFDAAIELGRTVLNQTSKTGARA